MADIFISYKREERTQVERLATLLRGVGFSVWFDASLSAGESFSDEIDREVRSARIVLVCWSPSAATSQWVKAEAQVGFSKGNLISTLVAGPDDFEPPVPFNATHTEDLRDWSTTPSLRDPAWRSVLRRAGELGGRVDVAEWGALGADASHSEVEGWFVRHGSTSPLVLEAESLLREREAENAARVQAETAARERLARLTVEREAAESEARSARERREAENRAQAAEARASRAERRARFSRRALVWGGGALGVAAAGGGAAFVGLGLYGEEPFLRPYLPLARMTEAGERAGLSITPSRKLSWQGGGSAEVLQFNNTGDRLLTAASYNEAHLWDALSGSQIAAMGHPSNVTSAAFSPTGQIIATASVYNAYLWSVSGDRTQMLQGHRDLIDRLAFSADGTRLATACSLTSVSTDRAARLWDTATGALIAVLSGHQGIVTSVAFSANGAQLATGSEDQTVRLWNAADGQLISVVPYPAAVSEVFYSPDGAVLFVDCGELNRFDVMRGTALPLIGGPEQPLGHPVLSPDGTLVAGIETRDNRSWTVGLWNIGQRTQEARLAGHTAIITSINFSADGRYILTGAHDQTVRLWDSNSGAKLATLSGNGSGSMHATFSPHGDLIATGSGGSGESFVRLWSISEPAG